MIASHWPPIIMDLCGSIEIVSHIITSNQFCMFISEGGKTNNGHSMLDLISICRGPNRGCGLTVHIYLLFYYFIILFIYFNF
jgi:hypothetical protein